MWVFPRDRVESLFFFEPQGHDQASHEERVHHEPGRQRIVQQRYREGPDPQPRRHPNAAHMQDRPQRRGAGIPGDTRERAERGAFVEAYAVSHLLAFDRETRVDASPAAA